MKMQLPRISLGLAVLAALGAGSAAASPAVKEGPSDLGSIDAVAGAAPLSVTLSLKLADEQGAAAAFREIYTPGGPNFHHFLTSEEYTERFAPSAETVAAVSAKLAAYGLTATRSGATTLRVTGNPADIERAFRVSLHVFEESTPGKAGVQRYHAPVGSATIPAEISPLVNGLLGLSDKPRYVANNLRSLPALGARKTVAKTTKGGKGTLVNEPGNLTVADFEQYYDVQPLIAKGVSGAGRTLGIVTLAAFTPSDAFAYWDAVGLKVSKNRISIVNIDGGPGAPSDESGSIETTLDVEQSGGVAPGADIIVYQAPNTNQGFLDAFVAAIDGNKAESVSVSWGAWEWFENLANSPVIDPTTGATVGELTAFDQVFRQASLQGQSMFAAAGDGGAYDANRGSAPPDYSLVLSVDNPASDPYITAAGGTTLAGTQTYDLESGQTVVVNIPNERVWSWDYLVPLCNDLQLDPIDCGIFPVGTGGGVSFEFALPFYQEGVAGLQRTQPYQVFIDEDTIPVQTLETLPSHYAGRNLPDISANADPDTGYVIYYTSSSTGFGIANFYGGTSFVGPQLNGVAALIGQYLHGRLGLLNHPLYQFQKEKGAYSGTTAPFNAIDSGNNDFYTGGKGYSLGAGIGTLDVFNFAEALKKGL